MTAGSEAAESCDTPPPGLISKPIELAGYDPIARSIDVYWMPRLDPKPE